MRALSTRICGRVARQRRPRRSRFQWLRLRGADLRGASLFGATFVDLDQPDVVSAKPPAAAILDASTQIDPAGLDALTPQQAEFVGGFLGRAYEKDIEDI